MIIKKIKDLREKLILSKKKYKNLISLINPYDRRKIKIIYLGNIIKSFSEFATIGIILPLLVALLKPTLISENKIISNFLQKYSPFRGDDLLIFSAVLIIFVYFLKNVYIFYFDSFSEKFNISLANNLSLRLLKNYLHSPYEFFINQKKSNLIQNINVEVKETIEGFHTPLLKLFSKVLTILLTLTFLFLLDFNSSFILVISITCSIYFFNKYTKKIITSIAQENLTKNREKNNYLFQAFNIFRETKIFGKEDFFINEVDKLNKSIINLSLKKAKIQILRPIFFEFVLIFLTILIIIYMVINKQNNEDIVIKMSIFVISAIRLLPISLQITHILNLVSFSKASLEVINKDLKELEKKVKNKSKINNFKKNIVLKNVSFKYLQSDEWVIKNLNLEIKKGQQVAFVGPSNAGKTTIIDIIIGLLKPTTGELQVDGKSMKKKNDTWSYKIGYIPQDIYITNDTIAKNVAFGYREKNIDKKKVLYALKLAQLSSLIKKLKNGIDSFIGDNGIKISGGQKQRLGIARALYHSPQILVMDEATAALDNKTEKQFITNLKSLHKYVTIIMIAHRLTTVENCDNIFFIHQGNLITQGKFNQIKENNLFKREVLGKLVKLN